MFFTPHILEQKITYKLPLTTIRISIYTNRIWIDK